MIAPTWSEQYSARFKTLSPRDVEVWEEIVAQTIHNVRDGEFLKAVVTLGEDKQNGKYAKYAPTVENLMSALKKNRWLARIDREGNEPSPEKCAFCGGTGWNPFGACVTNHDTLARKQVMSMGSGRHTSDGWPFYIFSVPCFCSVGGSQLKAYKSEDQAGVMALARKALDWKKTITADSPIEDRLLAADEG